MVVDPPSAPVSSLAAPPAKAVAPAKVRLRFQKGGDLRFVSHHDLMRTFERMLRRAALPFRSSQGFHPKPRLVFALSLPLGVVGIEEVVELELNESLPAEEVFARLAAQAPPGLVILSVRPIEFRAGAQVRRLSYRVALPVEEIASVRRRAGELLALAECRVERTRPAERSIDLRRSVLDVRITEQSDSAALEMVLCPTPSGTARPEEVLRFLGLERLLESGAVLERNLLELHDESPSPPAPADVIATASGSHSAGTPPDAEGIA